MSDRLGFFITACLFGMLGFALIFHLLPENFQIFCRFCFAIIVLGTWAFGMVASLCGFIRSFFK